MREWLKNNVLETCRRKENLWRIQRARAVKARGVWEMDGRNRTTEYGPSGGVGYFAQGSADSA